MSKHLPKRGKRVVKQIGRRVGEDDRRARTRIQSQNNKAATKKTKRAETRKSDVSIEVKDAYHTPSMVASEQKRKPVGEQKKYNLRLLLTW